MNVSKMGEFIVSQRNKLNLSQRELAEYLHITDKAVSKWERGLACPDVQNLQSLSVLFGCSISEIIEGTESDINSTSQRFDVENLPKREGGDFSQTVKVTLDEESDRYVSPLLFGDNLEHTRDCVNSGISAQMLKNRKFAGKPGRYGCAECWKSVGEKTYLTFTEGYTRHGEGYKMKRRFERNSQTITNFSETPAGIYQDGLFVSKNKSYVFAGVFKAVSPLVLSVSLSSADGEIYDKREISVENTEYERFEFELIPTKDDKNAKITLSFSQKGCLSIGALSLMPKDNFRGMRKDVIEKLKELSVKILRWPGGNFAGEYHWLDGLLPVDERAPFQSFMWIETQPHTFGYDFSELNTDDFVALCKEIGALPFITINPTWNTAEESAAWVEYCNGDETTEFGRKRIERGFKEPYNVQFWSLGNEFGYGHMEGANTPAEYAALVSAHAEKMLKVTPNLTLCSSGPYPNENWVKYSAKVLSDVAPVVSLHNYPDYPKWHDPEKYKQEYNYLLNEIDNYFIRDLVLLRKQLGDDKIKISVDEWNVWYAWYRLAGVYEGIYAAAFMNAVFCEADKNGIFITCHFESVNEGAISVYPDKAVLNPAGVAMSLMAKHSDGRALCLERDVVITEKQGIKTCTLINRSFDKEKSFILPKLGALQSGTCYTAQSIEPGTVFEKIPAALTDEKENLGYCAPKHSITQFIFK